MWGSSALDVFIRGLFLDSRDVERRGLPAVVAAELMFLAKTNKVLRAMDAVNKLGLSFPEAFRLIDEGDEARLVAIQGRAAQQESVVMASRYQTGADGYRHLRKAAISRSICWLPRFAKLFSGFSVGSRNKSKSAGTTGRLCPEAQRAADATERATLKPNLLKR